ncbi:MAG: hypothetical protein WCL22_04845 [bacterium]
MKKVLVAAILLVSVFQVMADDISRLQCDATSKNQASFKAAEAGKTTLAVDVMLNGQAVRRVIVYGENKRLAVLEAVRSTQLKNHAAVDTSDPRRWSVYNTWEEQRGDPSSARVNIDRNSGEIAFETKVHTGSDWQSAEYSGNCNKVGGNNTRF